MENEQFDFLPKIVDLTPVEKEISALLQKASYYIQTYRSIDALCVLKKAAELIDTSDVQRQIKVALYRNMGQARIQAGEMVAGIQSFICAMTSQGKTSEFTSAQITDNERMKLNWHYFGESDNYYMVLYRRR